VSSSVLFVAFSLSRLSGALGHFPITTELEAIALPRDKRLFLSLQVLEHEYGTANAKGAQRPVRQARGDRMLAGASQLALR
jgi:hypothetical protein